MLVIDTTGSMGDEIRYFQAELAVDRQFAAGAPPGARSADRLRVLPDVGDDYVTATVPLTGDFNRSAGSAAPAIGRWRRGLSRSDGTGADPRRRPALAARCGQDHAAGRRCPAA